MGSKELKPADDAGKPRRKPPAAGIGRKKGVPNKVTGLLKDAILEAATAAGGSAGLVGYLKSQAEANPQAFLPLLGKVIPLQVQHEGAIRIERVDVKFVGDDDQ